MITPLHTALASGYSAGQLEELEGEARGPGLEIGRHRRVLQSLAVRGVRGADQLPVVEVNPELEWRPVSWGDIVISSVLNTEYGGGIVGTYCRWWRPLFPRPDC